MNTIKTTLLLGTLTGLLMTAGYALGGQNGMLMMLIMSAVMNVGTWFFADSIVLRTSGAVPIEDPRLQWLEDDIAAIAARAGMPKPRLFLVPHEMSPNAFATGRSPSKGVVAVTMGLLQTLDRRQIRGVLAHEIGHIRNRDTLVSAVAATIAGAVSYLAHSAMWFGLGRGDDDRPHPAVGLLVMIVAPITATMLHLAISRTREYGADRRAAELTGDPEGLAQALERLANGGQREPMHTGSPSTHYIVNNFAGGMGKLFSTHPPMDERIRRLRAMGSTASPQSA